MGRRKAEREGRTRHRGGAQRLHEASTVEVDSVADELESVATELQLIDNGGG